MDKRLSKIALKYKKRKPSFRGFYFEIIDDFYKRNKKVSKTKPVFNSNIKGLTRKQKEVVNMFLYDLISSELDYRDIKLRKSYFTHWENDHWYEIWLRGSVFTMYEVNNTNQISSLFFIAVFMYWRSKSGTSPLYFGTNTLTALLDHEWGHVLTLDLPSGNKNQKK